MKKITCLIVFLLPLFARGQGKVDTDYPQDYFRNPLDIPIFLAGNFGECRPGHFHSGLDIKTNGEENQAVHAAADGYVSRIKMDKGGFGHALYITHANGYTTLYAHLNNFVPEIQQYLRQEQYKQEKWDIDIQLSPQQFPVKKGQQIAWSGNTGSSTAPHLHFEIRDNRTEHPLNPELFGLPVVDNIAPVPHELAMYNLNSSIYEQKPHLFALQKKGNEYKTKIDTIKTGTNVVGVGLNIDDYMDSSTNTLAFYSASLYLDEVLQTEIKLDDIGYDLTRYVNAYADYKTKEEQGKWVQLLFKLPNNDLGSIYSHLNKNNGVLMLSADHTQKARIEIVDDKGNNASVVFYLRYAGEQRDSFDPVDTNCLFFRTDLINSFEKTNIIFSLDNHELYSNICFKYRDAPKTDAYSDMYMLHHSYVPLHHSFELKIKPNKVIPFALPDKIALMYTDGKDTNGKAAYPADHGWYKATVRSFGTYWLVADTIKPVIRSVIKEGPNLSRAGQIAFTVKDACTSIKHYKGEIDGKWVCFEQHNDLFFYNFDEHCSKGKHELVFTATDENNNTATTHITFIRQ